MVERAELDPALELSERGRLIEEALKCQDRMIELLTIGSSSIEVSIGEIPFQNFKPISPRLNGRLLISS